LTYKSHDEVLIRVEHVSKKFCRSLKRSLWYGLQDAASAMMPWTQSEELFQSGASLQFPFPPLRKDEFWAVRDVSFEVKRGECLGLIGHNGAGKSTLLKMLNRLNRPDAGRITMRGRVGALIELNAGFNPILTGRENIYNQAALLGFSKKETDDKFDEIVDFSELEEFLDMPIQNYSSGMRMKLGFSVYAHLEPDILIVDEVLAVGDVGFRQKSLNKMAELLNRCAVVFVSHSMPQIFRVCNELLLLENGKCVFHGSDVGAGVERFFGRFNHYAPKVATADSLSIESTTMLSGEKVSRLGEALCVNYGDDIVITIEVSSKRNLKKAKLHYLVWSMELLPVMDIMGPNLSGIEFEINEGGITKLETTVRNCQLSAGKYTLSVVINSSDNKKVLLRMDSIAQIIVRADTFSGSHVVLCADWEIESSKSGIGH
jgi:lipopolysaccharide transport system ATP-binding protein